jgi:hypothetical protein
LHKKSHSEWLFSSLFGFLVFGIFDAVTFVEPVDATIGGGEFLFSRKERMTIGAGINADFFRRGACDECVSAGTASHRYLIILRMNAVFHVSILLLP